MTKLSHLHGFLVNIYTDLNDCLFGISVGINLFKNDFRRFSECIFRPPLCDDRNEYFLI